MQPCEATPKQLVCAPRKPDPSNMTKKQARSLARLGELCIQEAILGLLRAGPSEGLKLGKIRKPLRLPDQGRQATVVGQLRILESKGLVHQPEGERMEWALTAAGRNRPQMM